MAKIPVGRTIAHACRFAFGDFFKILGVMWLPMAIMWLPSLLFQRRLMALSTQMSAQDYSGLRQMWPIFLPLYLAAFVLMFMQFVGIAQLALGRRTGPSWFYFSLGKPVWRLIGSFLLLIVAIFLGWLAALLCDGLIVFLVKLVGTVGTVLSVILGILAALLTIAPWCALFYGLIRLSFLLTPVVAAEENGFALERSWTLGLGNFWRMFVIILVIFAPFLILEFGLLFGFMFKGISFPPPHASPEQLAAYQAAIHARSMEMMNVLYDRWYITYPAFVVVFILLYGTSVGAQCFAYRALTKDEASAPVAAD